MKRILSIILMVIFMAVIFVGCDDSGSRIDTDKTIANANTLQVNQPTPTDIEYSLERYNLIRRAYWVNGQREKANTLSCEIEKTSWVHSTLLRTRSSW